MANTHNETVNVKMRSQIHLVTGCEKDMQAEALPQGTDVSSSLWLSFTLPVFSGSFLDR